MQHVCLVDRFQHLRPAADRGDDFVAVGDLFKGFGMGVVIVEESIDDGLWRARANLRSAAAARTA